NSNSKAAYRSYQAAADLAGTAEQALALDADALLAASDRHLLRQHLDFRGVRKFAELCVAVSKYVYSTTSGAVAKKHDALAKLAHQAAVLTVPDAVASESLRLLPTLLLAAYHRHRAESYYRAEKVPEMSLVLGHIDYAWRLVEDMQQHCMEVIASSSSRSRRQGGKRGVLGRLSAMLTGGSGASAEVTSSDDEDNGQRARRPFAKLARLLKESDLVSVFPLADTILTDIVTLHETYHHENDVIYYARAAREEDVIADTPEVEPLPSEGASNSTTPVDAVPLSTKLGADMSKFSELPSGEVLQKLLQQQEETRDLRDTARRQLDEVRCLIGDMKAALQLPAAVEVELMRVERLLRGDGGAATTLDARFDAAHDAVQAALQRHETVSGDLYRAKSEYIGEYVAGFKSTASLRGREEEW
ncbi:hypothetical protein DQ04_21401000, partial [Trypanosoma grayi]|uniref:hypothetical protein n=1 Tax=Trypanosoma grayi TaxID=71804 RepID=UPI0004F3F697